MTDGYLNRDQIKGFAERLDSRSVLIVAVTLVQANHIFDQIVAQGLGDGLVVHRRQRTVVNAEGQHRLTVVTAPGSARTLRGVRANLVMLPQLLDHSDKSRLVVEHASVCAQGLGAHVGWY